MSPKFAECLTPEVDSGHVPNTSALAGGFRYRAISRRNGTFLNLCAVAIVFASVFTPANAYFDQGICCMLAVRADITSYNDDPWTVCDTDHSYVYLSPGPYTSVKVTMGWCQQNCGGYKLSSSDEWLRPLATWILPTIALLLLCSVGEDQGGREAYWWKKIYRLCFGYKAREYVALIGDPASAICGGFSEIFTDARVLLLKPRNWSEKAMVGVSTLAGSSKFNVAVVQPVLRTKDHPENSQHQQQDTALLETSTATDYPSRAIEDKVISVTQEPPIDSEVQTRLFYGIRVILTARLDFINAIFLPVVLLFATTVASFHDAYDSKGDVDTAHNLAYGVWYSWVIILAVVSNSYAASVNPGVAEAAIRDLVDLPSGTLPLRKRFPNSIQWGDGLERLCGGSKDLYSSKLFYPTYVFGQLLGWACVAVASTSASIISYNTPTVGVDCGTFTYILYGTLSFVIALLLVLRHWVASKVQGRPKPADVLPIMKGSPVEGKSQVEEEQQTPTPLHRAWKMVDGILKAIYALLVFINAFVLFGSTLFFLIGLYRSCRCQALFGSSTGLLELNFYTQQAIDNAGKFWLPVGYMCFSFVWVICMVAIVLRTFLHINFHRRESPFSGAGFETK